jgi:hypothetical protein
VPLAAGVLALLNPNIKLPGLLVVYCLFSFYWITLTLGYVAYLTFCGVGSSWYFLNDTPYLPRSPTWESYKRAWTTSFGSAAIAGFLLAVIQTLKALANTEGSKSQAIDCLRCIAMCILAVLEVCIKMITRYALIYCATFGVPFKEGCRRWGELGFKKLVDCLISGNVIGECLFINWLVFSGGGALLSYGIGYASITDNVSPKFGAAVTAVIGLLVTIAIYAILSKPIQAISDTVLICFSEAPDQLQTSAHDLHVALADHYGQNARKSTR